MRWPPNQISATLDTLITSVVTGSISACHRPASSAVPDSALLVSAKRLRSNGSRAKARTTRRPVSCSRITRLIASIWRCSRRKIGSRCDTIQ